MGATDQIFNLCIERNRLSRHCEVSLHNGETGGTAKNSGGNGAL
ncbi:hypothetical protein J2Z75_005283 [Rhizobium herbae]|uniref:Uncharacterized protein n=1 Tax=Rhizobium herbae TaxID=508661 RepID=A0ABS4EUW6_9HYPH|nr:hypothetical protein [Rhizobium herbae]